MGLVLNWLSFMEPTFRRTAADAAVSPLLRQANDSGARLEVIAVRCEDWHNLHVVTRSVSGHEESQLLVRGMTERECREAMTRCREALAELFNA